MKIFEEDLKKEFVAKTSWDDILKEFDEMDEKTKDETAKMWGEFGVFRIEQVKQIDKTCDE